MNEPTKQETQALNTILQSGALSLRGATVSFYIDKNGVITSINRVVPSTIVLFTTSKFDASQK